MGTRVLGLVGMLSMLACEGSGNAPEAQQLEGARTELTTHKVQLSAEQAQQLEQRGANVQVLADYGSFKLVQVDDKALASLPEGAELRDDFNDILLNAGVIDTASAHGQSLRGMKLQAPRQALPPRAVRRPHQARVGTRRSRPPASRW